MPDDYEAAAEALALAFLDDPAWAHLLPDSESRGERLLEFFATEIGNLVPAYRELWVTEDGSGAALWGPPGRWRVPFGRTARPLRSMIKVFGPRLGLATWSQLRLERRHHRRPDHWYLHYIGIEPRCQGRGLGARLLAPVLELCDRSGIGAYLESSSDRNRVLYERHGFTLTDTFTLPMGGPSIGKMWRQPAPSDA